uniref:ATP synthase subunit gamma, mitochondrial n=1 Tax=Chromera velia CCMP2878 TaxID=1169474 RepID=A0A0G4I1I2_9ALVE|mmetsp:Transcript_4240/g.8622  ORF Transcript_4240/g.8622 Transcript_4240/m.8622 type:complete len:305 (+) Transcript_4240:283-1197(+)|eukprot:Cvel_10158.t1-p1 / transcript=Cvel_10158.t1 / gene=Cvel_10158 / organism=Chromera_velia_CCMP2878 / gene_product=ATP synthase subunit gamma, mitochondrial, putative / transcript_product=ATP synthase subunit gamma, mitochondrial, putative / location=Cvel_scaffold606:20797-26086(+) / protein_length=304 / sequence_SO=supercontig / SO=protein_coding / is_pseudo=false
MFPARQFVFPLARASTASVPAFRHAQVRNFPGSDKAVQARMKSVKNIQKITKAMKMVAASKLKGDQRRLEAGVPFARPLQDLINRIPKDPASKAPLWLLVCSTDKGLCGGVNSYVAKLARTIIMESEASGVEVKMIGLGDKIRAAMVRLFGDRFDRVLAEVTKNPWNFTMACALMHKVLEREPARLAILFNHFRSVISYDTTREDVLTPKGSETTSLKDLDTFEFEPERREIWNDLIELYLASTLYGAMLDNVASEQSARMSAMDNASKNAGEMLANLTLVYNKARQAKITMELIEIISGANAL